MVILTVCLNVRYKDTIFGTKVQTDEGAFIAPLVCICLSFRTFPFRRLTHIAGDKLRNSIIIRRFFFLSLNLCPHSFFGFVRHIRDAHLFTNLGDFRRCLGALLNVNGLLLQVLGLGCDGFLGEHDVEYL